MEKMKKSGKAFFRDQSDAAIYLYPSLDRQIIVYAFTLPEQCILFSSLKGMKSVTTLQQQVYYSVGVRELIDL